LILWFEIYLPLIVVLIPGVGPLAPLTWCGCPPRNRLDTLSEAKSCRWPTSAKISFILQVAEEQKQPSVNERNHDRCGTSVGVNRCPLCKC
jgi:hypothetical protein